MVPLPATCTVPGTMLRIVPCRLQEANCIVARLHRHHGPVRGHKFSLAIMEGVAARGVAIIGRPVARMLDDGLTLEVRIPANVSSDSGDVSTGYEAVGAKRR